MSRKALPPPADLAENQVRRVLVEGALALDLSLSAEDLEALIRHYVALMKWRRRADLTALVGPVEIAVRHYLDSLTLAPRIPRGLALADLGTGAGFPGFPLAIVRPDLDVTLLETREVKLAFLHHVVTVARRPNLRVARTTDVLAASADAPFELVVARAVADVGETLQRCARLVSEDGQVWVMRGPSRSGEVEAGLRSEFRAVGEVCVTLPVEPAQRRIVMYQRLRP